MIENCDTCGPHLDRIRQDLNVLLATPTSLALTDAMVERVMGLIAPHLHAAVEDAEAGARMVVPEKMA